MSGTDSRPAPLRVPVADVTTRSSLVAPATATPVPERPSAPERPHVSERPRAPEPAVMPVVVQRPVRVISDRPRPEAAFVAPPIVDDGRMTRASFAPRSTTPTVRTSAVPPAAPLPGEVDNEVTARRVAYADVMVDVEPLELSGELPLDDAETVPQGAFGEDSTERSLDRHLSEEHEIDVDEALLAVPPPAPPGALRRSIPSPSNGIAAARSASSNDVEITVSYGDDDGDDDPTLEFDDERPSAEIEELELDPEELRTPPPPPPYGRLSMAEPADSEALLRAARVAEARPSRPRAHPWWEIFFDDDYLRTVRQPTREQISRQCDFIMQRLGLKPGSTLLDVGCGLGLQVIELASRGVLSVGLDLSLAMLSRASEEAQDRGVKVNFLHADMRDMNFDGNFDAVTCLGTSLGYFDDDANRKVIERLRRALKPQGVLLLDVCNRDHVIRSQPNLVWFEGDGCVCMEETEFNYFTSRLHVKRTVILDSGKQRENEYSLRLYSLHELGQLLHLQGFRVTEVSGREAVPGVFFGQESPNVLLVAERRANGDGTGKYPALSE